MQLLVPSRLSFSHAICMLHGAQHLNAPMALLALLFCFETVPRPCPRACIFEGYQTSPQAFPKMLPGLCQRARCRMLQARLAGGPLERAVYPLCVHAHARSAYASTRAHMPQAQTHASKRKCKHACATASADAKQGPSLSDFALSVVVKKCYGIRIMCASFG